MTLSCDLINLLVVDGGEVRRRRRLALRLERGKRGVGRPLRHRDVRRPRVGFARAGLGLPHHHQLHRLGLRAAVLGAHHRDALVKGHRHRVARTGRVAAARGFYRRPEASAHAHREGLRRNRAAVWLPQVAPAPELVKMSSPVDARAKTLGHKEEALVAKPEAHRSPVRLAFERLAPRAADSRRSTARSPVRVAQHDGEDVHEGRGGGGWELVHIHGWF